MYFYIYVKGNSKSTQITFSKAIENKTQKIWILK